MEKRDSSGDGFTYGALHLDSKPEWVFVFGSCAGVEPAQLNERMQILMLAAMAFYRKTHWLIIIDREKASYEVGLRFSRRRLHHPRNVRSVIDFSPTAG